MEKVRIQDDLYHHVNQEKLDSLVIPDDLPATGGFNTLHVEVEKLMIDEFNQMVEVDAYPNVHLQRACGLYKQALDVKKRNRQGIKPALKKVAILNKLDTLAKFNNKLAELVIEDLPLPFNIGVDTDMKDTNKHCLMISGPGVLLPDASYYKPEMEAQKQAMLGLWANMASQVLAETNLTVEEQAKYIQDTLAFDAILAKLVKTREEWSEYVNVYNPMKTSKVIKLVKPVAFKKLLVKLFDSVPEKVIVTEPRYFASFNEVFNEETFELYKHWAYVTAILGSCSLLSEKLRDLGGSFMRALSGIAAVTPVEKYAYQLASNMYSEPVGLYYGEKYFGEEAKKDITEIVYQIIDAYKDRIANNDILEEATKQKAILKLSKIGVKMGYPDKVQDIYEFLTFNEKDSLLKIVSDLKKVRLLHSLSKLNKPTDPTRWQMPGHMVNACYDPFVNDITFPAAILQAPFYSIKQTRSENLGGIGAVIGHEISHAFDSNGAKCDENGNINNWWTKKDNKKFNKKIEAMVKQFDGIELPWGKVNGRFIVSENMADNGGVAVTLQIMKSTPNASYEEYFKNWARVWCSKAKPEYSALLLNVDVHGPAILRANITVRNFEEWYETFNVKKSDKMYIAPSKRIVIW